MYLKLTHELCRSIDDIEKTMEQVEEHAENMKQIQDALATPVGAAADFDEVHYISNSY